MTKLSCMFWNKKFPAATVLSLIFVCKIPYTQTPVYFNRQFSSTKPKEQQRENQNRMVSAALTKAKEDALWGMLIADAMAMPVHWYYDPRDIKSGYGGWLTGYRAPEKRHPSSILTISATDSSGRSGWGEKSKPVIGNVILHDKLKYWTSKDNTVHYHQGMAAGDSTLNSLVALQFYKTMSEVDPQCAMKDRDLRSHVLADYVKFMTTPGSHNDTYAESFHRSFFKDWSSEATPPTQPADVLSWAEERYVKKTKGSSDHQLVVIGAFVPAIPWIIHNAHKSEEECAKSTIEFIKLTHPETSLVPYIDMYARLLHAVLNGQDLKERALKCLESTHLGGERKKQRVLKHIAKAEEYHKESETRLQVYQSATSQLGSACYVEGAFSSMLFLALEFADDFQAGVLGNANCGGENCHRGGALGALLGANAANKGQNIPQKLKDGLGTGKTVYAKILQGSNL